MITRFKEFLYKEITVMMMAEKPVRAPSRQSISNSSTSNQKDEPLVSSHDEYERAMFISSIPPNLYDEPNCPLDEEPDAPCNK